MNNDTLLAKWLNGDISEEELKALKASGELESYEKIITYTAMLKAPAFDKEAVLHEIQQVRKEQESSRVRKIRTRIPYARVAAVLCIALVSYVFLSGRDTVISTSNAETTDLVLPDDSHVTLNAGSELIYNKKQWARKREVHLKGEGFFRVSEGASFEVKTDQGVISVLGTAFNVNDRNDYFEVSCYRGAVRVIHGKDSLILQPGESFRAIQGIKTQKNNTAGEVPTWIHDETSFRSVPYSVVLKEFERQYNVDITAPEATDLYFTGSFSNKDIETALKSITLPFRLKYRFTDGKKEKVTIYTDKH